MIRRVGRLLFTLAAALSFLACITLTVLWVRNYRTPVVREFWRADGLWEAVVDHGRLSFDNEPQQRLVGQTFLLRLQHDFKNAVTNPSADFIWWMRAVLCSTVVLNGGSFVVLFWSRRTMRIRSDHLTHTETTFDAAADSLDGLAPVTRSTPSPESPLMLPPPAKQAEAG